MAAGGGGGYQSNGNQGGAGGGPTGGNGLNNAGAVTGTGATQAGGATTGGGFGTGGGTTTGGGGGGSNTNYGGGGSSWVTPTGSSGVVLTVGANAGDGSLTITPGGAYSTPALDGSNLVNVPGDNLGNHTATQNLNLGANLLVGNGGTAGLLVGSTGHVGIGTSAPNTRLSITPSTIEPKITLWDGGSANATSHYGFGISGGQLNYHVEVPAASHVFYAGGKNADGTELLRIQGNGNVSTSGELRVQHPNNRLRQATSPQSTTDQFGSAGVHISNYEVEEGGFWANGNYAAIYSPGDNDLVKFLDEDGFNGGGSAYDNGALKARIDDNGQYFQVSDAKAKHDITPIADGLRKLISLSGYHRRLRGAPAGAGSRAGA